MSGRDRPTRPRRADLSQHFLRDASARRLVRATSISNADLVIEIGGGRGALTKPLIQRAGRLIVVELDTYLAEKLARNHGESAEVVATDFLDFELPKTAYSVIGNIPYARSTQIIRKLIEEPNPPRDAWLVVQREVANRMCGRPFGKETLWSLRLKPFWHLEVIDRLGRNEFDPPPSVDSVFLQMSHRGRPIIRQQESAAYLEMLESAFHSNWPVSRALNPGLSKVQVRRLASDLHFHVDDRAADLFFEQWLGIFRFSSRQKRPQP